MDVSQLPDISGLLVTADNPARNDSSGMDYERCVALHNYLVHYAWIAEGRPPASLHGNNNNYFTTHGDAAETLRPRLQPSVESFLDAAMLPDDRLTFFWWANGISSPSFLFEEQAADLFDEPVDSLVCLYYPNVGQDGEMGGGVYYHQVYHRAAVFMHMDDNEFALPFDEHRELWHPLETVLSNWIELIHIGKVIASPSNTPALFDSEKIGPWEWRPYGEAQVTTCVRAWDRLCEAIEARMPLPPTTSTTTVTTATNSEPLISPAVLDAALVPHPGFVYSFLIRARRPHFDYIAPGLLLPPTDESEFAAAQPFTMLPRGHHGIPPICLFPSARGEREVDLTASSSPFHDSYRPPSGNPHLPSRVPAGVYSDSLSRNYYENAEEGFGCYCRTASTTAGAPEETRGEATGRLLIEVR